MRFWQRALVAVILALWVGLAAVRSVAACTCVAPSPPATAFSVMPAVFVGTVQSVRQGGGGLSWLNELLSLIGLPPYYFSGGLYVNLTVSRAWKGVSQTQVLVVTGGSGASCGLDFQLNQDYLIYAWPDTYGLTTNLCTRSAAVSAAAADLAYLQTIPTLALAASGGQPLLVGLALAAALALTLGALLVALLRRRRPITPEG